MAGQPKRQAEELSELAREAISVSMGAYAMRPGTYHERSLREPHDSTRRKMLQFTSLAAGVTDPAVSEIEALWTAAVSLTGLAFHAVEELANHLRAKAGMEPLDLVAGLQPAVEHRVGGHTSEPSG